MDQESIRWVNYEYNFKEKTVDWFWAVGISTLSAVIISVIFENYFFAIFIVLAIITMIFISKKPPNVIDFEINKDGIILGKQKYPYSSLEGFCIINRNYETPKLLIKSQRPIAPILIINVETDSTNPEDIRNFLLKYLPEENIVEPISLKLMETLGF